MIDLEGHKMDIRTALKNNLAHISAADLKTTIDSGIASKEETILPGLGVLFEMYYQSLNSQDQKHWLNQLSSLLS